MNNIGSVPKASVLRKYSNAPTKLPKRMYVPKTSGWIAQYSLDGKRVAVYTKETFHVYANTILKAHASFTSVVITVGKNDNSDKRVNNYLWRYSEIDSNFPLKVDPYRPQSNKYTVAVYNADGELLEIHDSLKSISTTSKVLHGGKPSGLSQAALQKRAAYRGYQLRKVFDGDLAEETIPALKKQHKLKFNQ